MVLIFNNAIHTVCSVLEVESLTPDVEGQQGTVWAPDSLTNSADAIIRDDIICSVEYSE